TDRNYVQINPNRRTEQAIDLVQPGSVQYHEIVDQEKLPSAIVLNLRAGWKLPLSKVTKKATQLSKNAIFELSVAINNLLNNQDIIMHGYEQLRYDFQYENPSKFPNTYTYAMGLTFSVTASLKF